MSDLKLLLALCLLTLVLALAYASTAKSDVGAWCNQTHCVMSIEDTMALREYIKELEGRCKGI